MGALKWSSRWSPAVPFILGIAFGWWLRARLRPNAKLDDPGLRPGQRSYLADLAEAAGRRAKAWQRVAIT